MEPKLARTIPEVRGLVTQARRSGRVVGVVPTMGALHEGHGALMDQARRECGYVVVTIFVNPIQFDRTSDYEAYAIDLGHDLAFCQSRCVDVVFAPSPPEMYPSPQNTLVEITGVSDHLCGRFRPGHFRGVATVVTKLFHIVEADRAYFGEKDAQQLAVIQRMVHDLNFPVSIVPVPTVREPDGLALSSRNRRLSAEDRRVAAVLFRSLETARKQIEGGAVLVSEVREAALQVLDKEPRIRLEYFELVDPRDLQPLDEITGPARVAAAVWLGETRLIDNVLAAPPVRGNSNI